MTNVPDLHMKLASSSVSLSWLCNFVCRMSSICLGSLSRSSSPSASPVFPRFTFCLPTWTS